MQVTTFSKREQVTQAVLTLAMAKVGVPLKHSLEFMFQVFTIISIDLVPFYPTITRNRKSTREVHLRYASDAESTREIHVQRVRSMYNA